MKIMNLNRGVSMDKRYEQYTGEVERKECSLMSLMKDKYKTMSKGQKLLAQYTIDNYQKVAFMTASKLGETVGVSESTVVRFANALGFSGYPKFQDALQELIKTKLTTVQRVEMANNDYSNNSLIDRKSTRLNSSHANISYAVFCLKKKKHTH